MLPSVHALAHPVIAPSTDHSGMLPSPEPPRGAPQASSRPILMTTPGHLTYKPGFAGASGPGA